MEVFYLFFLSRGKTNLKLCTAYLLCMTWLRFLWSRDLQFVEQLLIAIPLINCLYLTRLKRW